MWDGKDRKSRVEVIHIKVEDSFSLFFLAIMDILIFKIWITVMDWVRIKWAWTHFIDKALVLRINMSIGLLERLTIMIENRFFIDWINILAIYVFSQDIQSNIKICSQFQVMLEAISIECWFKFHDADVIVEIHRYGCLIKWRFPKEFIEFFRSHLQDMSTF